MVRRVAAMGVLCALAFAGAACSNTSNKYGAATEAAFLETCTVQQQQPRQICACMYTEITQQVPFDRYVELDKQMQKDEKFVPDELESIAADCTTQLTTTTTESTTTTTTGSTTTTTTSSSGPSSSSSSSSSPSSASPSS